MVRRVISGLVCAVVLVLIYVGYKNWSFKRAMLSGEVSGGSGETTPQESSAVLPGAGKAADRQKAAVPEQTAPNAAKQIVNVPPEDTISPQPPNGAVFAGTGHFQVYRQGNLTWRLNTDTGQTCILFATNEEWKKPIVSRNGCRNNAAQ